MWEPPRWVSAAGAAGALIPAAVGTLQHADAALAAVHHQMLNENVVDYRMQPQISGGTIVYWNVHVKPTTVELAARYQESEFKFYIRPDSVIDP